MTQEYEQIDQGVGADALRGVLACAIGMIVFLALDQVFHGRAAYYLEMGDRSWPGYAELNRFFMWLPYLPGALVAGLFAGAGRLTRLRYPLIRLLVGVGGYTLLNVAYTALYHRGLVAYSLSPLLPALVAFAASLAVDRLYRQRAR